MGIFGAGIFADDDARDIRADYKYFLADAQSDEGATDAAAREFGAAFDHPEQNTSFWLALAWTQWTVGRLDPRVKDTALRVIDDGLDLKRWENSPLRAKREKALAAARVKLLSPQPAAKALPRPLPVQLPGWQFGEVIGVRLAQGRLALLHMIAYRKSSRYDVKAPVVSILNWLRAEQPALSDLGALTYIDWRKNQLGQLYNLASPRRNPISAGRFERLGLTKPVTRAEAKSPYIGLQRDETLDQLLESVLWPYWENPSLPPHHPPFDQPEAEIFKAYRKR